MKRVLACSVLTLSLCLGGMTALADGEENFEIAAVEQNINEIKNELSSYESAQAEIENINQQTENLNGQLESLKNSEVTVNQELGNLNSTYESKKDLAIEKVNEIYQNQEGGYEAEISKSEDVNDFFNKIDEVKKVVEEDKELQGIKEIKSGMNEKASLLQNVQTQMEPIKNEIQDLQNMSGNYKEVEERIEYLTSQLNSLENRKEELNKINTNEGKRNSIVETSQKYLGTPYVWGGTTPRGFDCSGFVQYVYSQNGIAIPRVTTGQEYAGIDVTGQQLMPGDLVLWGNRGATYHVGMYIGNGKYIHSPQTGDVVRIASLNNYSVARRILY